VLSIKSIGYAAAVSIPVILATCAIYPFVHNNYIHPLGRLSRTISEGDQCDQVRKAFREYVAAHPSPDLQFTEPNFTADILRTKEVTPAIGLFLYDLSTFDDLQLTVRCNSEGKVAEVLFIGD
jgi:hypothetical protein